MAMVVKNNISANQTLNQLNKNSSALKSSLEKVASGMKINSAKDDASGYAISEGMRVQIRALDQANSNSQNASSMIKVAEGAVSTTLEIVKTMKEKAINAANDTNTDADRLIIQKEINEFIDQVDDNALTTFNGKILLNGDSMPLNHHDYDIYQNIVRGLNSEWIQSAMDLISESYGLDFTQNGNTAYQIDIEFEDDASKTNIASCGAMLDPTTGQVVDGKLIMTFNMANMKNLDSKSQDGLCEMKSTNGNWFKGNLDRVITHELVHGIMFSKFGALMDSGVAGPTLPSWLIEGGTAELVHGADDMQNVLGVGSAAACVNGSNDYAGGFVAMRYFSQTSNVDPVKAMKQFMKILSDGGSVDDAFSATSHGRWNKVSDFVTEFSSADTAAGGWTNLLTQLGIDTTNTDTGAVTGKDAGGKVTKTAKSVVHEVSSTVNWRLPAGTQTMVGGLLVNWPPAMNTKNGAGGDLRLHVGTESNQRINIGFNDMRAKAIGLYDEDGEKINVTTQGKARAAIATFDRIVNLVVDQQTNIGAMLQRMDYTSANLVTGTENTQAAESVIRDSDMAKEMTNYTKNNVLLQAAQSMLAQANQSSSAVLSLLQ